MPGGTVTKALLLASVLALPSVTARADPTAWEVLSRPAAPYGTDYLSGLTDGMGWVNAKVGRQQLFCPPPALVITSDQYREILRRKVETGPSLASAPAGYVLMLALVEIFPCPAKP